MALACKNCGGKIIFDPQNKTVYCDCCGSNYNLLNTSPQDLSVLEDLNISKNELRVYQQAVQCMEKATDEADWINASDMFSLVLGVLDASELQQMCLQQAEFCKEIELCEEAFKLSESDNIYSLKRAAQLFSQNPQWKNSEENLKLCNEKIAKLEKSISAQQKASERKDNIKKSGRSFALKIISIVAILALIVFIYRGTQKHNVDNIKIDLISMESEYHRNESPYINGCYYIYFNHKIENNTLACIDYINTTTQLKDENGKLIYQITSNFGGYVNSSLQLEKGQEITLETYIKDQDSQDIDAFNNVFDSELSDFDVSISIDSVKFSDGHYYNK